MDTQNPINWVAIYAAGLSTFVFFWQLILWRWSGARLSGRANANMEVHGGAFPDNNTYVVMNIQNVGRTDTTITTVALLAYSPFWRRLKSPESNYYVVHNQDTYPLPYVLRPGQTFTSMVIQDEKIERLSNNNRLYAAIYHAMSSRPLRLYIPPIEKAESSKAKSIEKNATKPSS